LDLGSTPLHTWNKALVPHKGPFISSKGLALNSKGLSFQSKYRTSTIRVFYNPISDLTNQE
jgi:hypothetical protein